MSKVSESDPEELDEIDDDAIVAQQSAAHEPQRRVRVQVESRSVVVAEPEPADRKLDVYDAKSNDPTVVVRDRRRRAELIDDLPTEFRKKRNWGAILVWLLAALTAFALGGLISIARSSSGATPSASSAGGTASAVPETPPAVATTAEAPPSASTPDQAVPAVDLDQLPVEHRRHVAAAPRSASPPAAPHSTAHASKPAPGPATPAAIPEGI